MLHKKQTTDNNFVCKNEPPESNGNRKKNHFMLSPVITSIPTETGRLNSMGVCYDIVKINQSASEESIYQRVSELCDTL